jgi:hypothetical protein
MSTESDQPAQTNPAALQIIRLMLLVTVTGLAVLAILRHRENDVGLMQYVPPAVAVAMLAMVFVFREKAMAAAGEQYRVFTIIAWALGESAALLGWVVHLVGGPLMFALPGTAVFLIAIVAVPASRQEGS